MRQRCSKLYDAMGPGIEISGGSVANTMVGVASFGGKAGFIGKTADDQFGKVFRHDIRAAGVTFTTPRGKRRRADRAFADPGDAGRPAHDEHRAGREPAAGRRRGGCRSHPLGAHSLSRGLPVRPARGQGGLPAGGGYRRQGRAAGGALAVRSVLRRPAPAGVPGAGARSSVDILFANEAEITSLYQTQSFDDAADQAQRDTKLAAHHALGEGQRDPGRRASRSPYRRRRWPRWWTPRAPAIFMRRASCSAWQRASDLETAGRLGSLAAAEIISHVGARPEVKLAELAKQQGLL